MASRHLPRHWALIVPVLLTVPLVDADWVEVIGLVTVEPVATTELLTMVCEPIEEIVKLPPLDPLEMSTPLWAPFAVAAAALFKLCAPADSSAPLTAAPDDVVPH